MIHASRKDNLGAVSNIRSHQLVSGVSEKLGGADEGFNPHELLEAALASCTIITVQMYANRKQWPLVSTHVDVHTEREGPTGAKISRVITFEGDLNDEQRARLLEIANKCPIHSLLSRPIEVDTRLG